MILGMARKLIRSYYAKETAEQFLLHHSPQQQFHRYYFEPEITQAIRRGVEVGYGSVSETVQSLDRICSFYLNRSEQWKTITTNGKYDPVKREQNAAEVNRSQFDFLQELYGSKKDVDGNFPMIYRTQMTKDDLERMKQKLAKPKRNLVLYGRFADQMDILDFSIALFAAKAYVEGGYSRVITDVKVTGSNKADHAWAKEWLSMIIDVDKAYLTGTKQDFIMNSAIGANTAHFNKGMLEQSYYGGVSIAGLSVLSDSSKVAGTVIPLRLEYGAYRQTYDSQEKIAAQFEKQNGSIERIINEMLRAIRELEHEILNGAGQPKQ